MAEAPATRPSLLVRLRDPDDAAAWNQFVDLYAPLVYAYGRRNGLQDADAADLTQEVLRVAAASARRLDYDPRRSRFRGWLFTVARNELRDLLARRRRPGQGTGGTTAHELLDDQPSPNPEEEWWDREHGRRLFAWAAEQVRGQVQETTWQAFWQTAVEGRSGEETAKGLGMSVAAVYLAKSRIMARLKEQIQSLEDT